MRTQFVLDSGADERRLTVEELGDGVYRVTQGEREIVVDARRLGESEYHLLCEDQGHDVLVERVDEGGSLLVHRDGGFATVTLLDERQAARLSLSAGARRGARGAGAVRAPMPGKVVKTLVKAGDQVSAGQGIIIIEAMKMENELRTASDGTVKEIRVSEGDAVEAGENLVLIE